MFELAREMGTSVRMIERHYGTLVDGAHAAITDRSLALVMPPEVRRNLMATRYVARLGVEIPETLAPGIEIELH